jgi:hypothetical protein
VTGAITVEVPASSSAELTVVVQGVSVPMTSSSRENPDRQNFTSSRMGFEFQIVSMNQIPARTNLQFVAESSNVEQMLDVLNDALKKHGGRVTSTDVSQGTGGRTVATWSAELSSESQNNLVAMLEAQTKITARQQTTNADAPVGPASRTTIELMLKTPDTLVAPGSGFWNTIVQGVKTSVAGLLWSLQLIVVGLFLVGPWVVIGWVGYKIVRRRRAPVPA